MLRLQRAARTGRLCVCVCGGGEMSRCTCDGRMDGCMVSPGRKYIFFPNLLRDIRPLKYQVTNRGSVPGEALSAHVGTFDGFDGIEIQAYYCSTQQYNILPEKKVLYRIARARTSVWWFLMTCASSKITRCQRCRSSPGRDNADAAADPDPPSAFTLAPAAAAAPPTAVPPLPACACAASCCASHARQSDTSTP